MNLKEGKPFLRCQIKRGSTYISVAQKKGVKLVTLRSFGNAKDYSNWLSAINFLLLLLEDWYKNMAAGIASECT